MPRDHRASILTAAAVSIALGSVPAHATAPDVAAELRATADVILAGERHAVASPHKALLRLLEITVQLGKEGRLASPVLEKLDVALAEARSGTVLERPVRAALAAAYAAQHGGHEFAFPRGVTTPEGARAAAAASLEASLAALDAGRRPEAVAALLDLLLQVVTPMEMEL